MLGLIKVRAGLLGLLAMLLVGSFAAASASAQGPFFHHRNKGETGNGVKWNQQTSKPPWEAVEGSGGEAKLKGKVLSIATEITAEGTEVKGIVFNNALQGQTKVLLTYLNPKVAVPASSHCSVIIGTNNVVKLYGHQAWTWNGTEEQLKEQPQKAQKPDWIFLPSELQQGAEGLPTNLAYTTLTFSNNGGTCLLDGTFAVEGSTAAAVEPAGVEEFSTKETQRALPNEAGQHFWNGKKNVGVKTALKFAGSPAVIEQTDTVKTIGTQGFEPQELAHFES